MKLTKILSAAIIVSAVSSVFALDGRTVMQNAYDVKEPYFSHALVQMDLISKDGSVESRKVEEYGRSRDNIKDAVFVFLDPPSVKNTRFLQKENKDRDDDKMDLHAKAQTSNQNQLIRRRQIICRNRIHL